MDRSTDRIKVVIETATEYTPLLLLGENGEYMTDLESGETLFSEDRENNVSLWAAFTHWWNVSILGNKW